VVSSSRQWRLTSWRRISVEPGRTDALGGGAPVSRGLHREPRDGRARSIADGRRGGHPRRREPRPLPFCVRVVVASTPSSRG